MKDVMGMIYTGEHDALLRELTITRAVAALPLAGRYRVIDFILSGMVNSGIRNVGVIMQKNYHSLMDHLGSGKEWDLHGKNDGLFILPPFLTRDNVGVYGGVLDALRSNAGYLSRSKQEDIILCNSNMVFNANFEDMVACHRESGADITLLYTKDPAVRRRDYGCYLTVDKDATVKDMEIEPTEPKCENTMMEVCLMRRELLRSLVDQGVAHGFHDFNRDVLQRVIREGTLKVKGYLYTDQAWRMDSVQAYFQCNMALLDSKVRRQVFDPDKPVYTKVRDEMPAKYSDNAQIINSLVADGCIIEGNVENSVIFRGVRIAPDAQVKNCIIMQDTQIMSGAQLENCILDKQVVIKRNARLIGPAAYPIVIAKKVVI